MELFSRLRRVTGERILKRRTARSGRKRGFVNLDSIRSLCLIWDAEQSSDLSSVTRFLKEMSDSGREAHLAIVCTGKRVPDSVTALRSILFVKREDLNLFYIPKGQDVALFISRRYDLLVDVSFRDLLPLRYLFAVSDATLKVAPVIDRGGIDYNLADLMIETGGKKDTKLFLNEMVRYLKMINAPAADREGGRSDGKIVSENSDIK